MNDSLDKPREFPLIPSPYQTKPLVKASGKILPNNKIEVVLTLEKGKRMGFLLDRTAFDALFEPAQTNPEQFEIYGHKFHSRKEAVEAIAGDASRICHGFSPYIFTASEISQWMSTNPAGEDKYNE